MELTPENSELMAVHLKQILLAVQIGIRATEGEIIPYLEQTVIDYEKAQYQKECLAYDEFQSADFNLRMDLLKAVIELLKARDAQMKEAPDIERRKIEHDSFMRNLDPHSRA
jgi:hypothetical protein